MLEKAEDYAKTSIESAKLNAIDKVTKLVSIIIPNVKLNLLYRNYDHFGFGFAELSRLGGIGSPLLAAKSFNFGTGQIFYAQPGLVIIFLSLE